MVEFCSKPEGVEGLNEESIEEWRDLRTRLIEKLRDPDYNVPEQLHLSDECFDSHGPLYLPFPLQLPPSSDHADIERGVHRPPNTGSASDGTNEERSL